MKELRTLKQQKEEGRLGSSSAPAPNILVDTEPSRQILGILHFKNGRKKYITKLSWGPWDKIHTHWVNYVEVEACWELWRCPVSRSLCPVNNRGSRLGTWLFSCAGCLERWCKMCLTYVTWAQRHLLEPWGPMHSSACQWANPMLFLSQYTACADIASNHLWAI